MPDSESLIKLSLETKKICNIYQHFVSDTSGVSGSWFLSSVHTATYIDCWIQSIANQIGCVKADFTETIIMHVHWKGAIILAHCNLISSRLVNGELSFNVDIAKLKVCKQLCQFTAGVNSLQFR